MEKKLVVGITGANGFLGANLAEYLISRNEGIELRPFYSRSPGHPFLDAHGLDWRKIDVCDRASLERGFEGLDLLFHCAGLVEYARKGRERSWDVNVLGTKAVYEAAGKAGIPKIVYVSSVSVLGHGSGEELCDEETSPYGVGNPVVFASREDCLDAIERSLSGDYSFMRKSRVPYFDTKLAAWELTKEAAAGGTPVSIAMPATSVGAGERAYGISQLIKRIARQSLRATFPGATSFVAVKDVAEGLWAIAEKGAAGRSYILSGGESANLSYKAFSALIARIVREDFGKPCQASFGIVPSLPSRIIGYLSERLNINDAMNLGFAVSGIEKHKFSCARAEKELGYAPRHGLEDSIRDAMRFLIANGDLW